MLGTFSSGIQRLRLLPVALGMPIVSMGARAEKQSVDAIIGWGLKENTRRPVAYAHEKKLAYYTLEDGFIRSIGLGVTGSEPFGFVVDKTGIYYDATRPSDLENLIIENEEVDTEGIRAIIGKMTAAGISKYNHTWSSVALPTTGRPRILLIDQTYDDLSVRCGLADAQSFVRMLKAAREMYPDGRFFVKTHPDVLAGKKRGYLTTSLPPDVRVLDRDCNPTALLQQVDHVFTVTSQMGFEALLLGRRVSCFGMPFYAGWGLTDDHVSCPRRKVRRSLESVFEAAYSHYTRYVDPVTAEPCTLERIVEFIGNHARVASQNTGTIYAYGFRFWKRGIIKRFMGGRKGQVHFRRRALRRKPRGADASTRVLAWGFKDGGRAQRSAVFFDNGVERVEDGFIRSVGLGSNFSKPSSLILDRQGIYFDPRHPSDLENLLNTVQLDDDALGRARRLQAQIVSAGISKYNNGEESALVLRNRSGQRIILVPGQVEDDASIQTGGVDIKTNIGLLRAVRENHPGDFIVYKPHPDVLAGNRRGRVGVEAAGRHCDQIVTGHNMCACLDQVDQVHTITSLTGFEALLRGKRVVTYGLPFYAGWGLTVDRHPIGRRQREVSLETLVYCSLILYPRYYNWQFNCFVSAEDHVSWMQRQNRRSADPFSGSPVSRWFCKLRHLIENMQITWAN